MKKLLLCFVAIATMAAVSCKKETNPAEDFVGNYTVKTSAHLTIPVIGNMDQDLDDMDCTIALKGEEGDVTITMAGETTTGHVTEAGMTVQPLVTTQEIMGQPVDITVNFPTIPKPVNGTTSWQSTLTASVSGISINGTADMTATKK
ncbi:MAG: hypothetical protein K5918_03355 [Bacteroidales bacterium]|jgi:hypothetical protein|nr:hypothetical protein [Bacteroidales bacterium]